MIVKSFKPIPKPIYAALMKFHRIMERIRWSSGSNEECCIYQALNELKTVYRRYYGYDVQQLIDAEEKISFDLEEDKEEEAPSLDEI